MKIPSAEQIYREITRTRPNRNYPINECHTLYTKGITNLQRWTEANDLVKFLEEFQKETPKKEKKDERKP